MAKSISEEELQLRKRARRRLIGAIALVTIVAVFLPMVLEHEPKPVSQDITIQIPSPNSGAFTSELAPMPDAKSTARPGSESAVKPDASGERDTPKIAAAPAVRGGSADALAPPAHDTEAAPPKIPVTAQLKPAVAPPERSAPAPTAADQARAEAKDTGTYVVQVAALNDANMARQMQEKIAAAGIKAYTEVVPTVKGNVTRVRAGPFATRGDAEKVRAQLKDMGLNGNLVPKNP